MDEKRGRKWWGREKLLKWKGNVDLILKYDFILFELET